MKMGNWKYLQPVGISDRFVRKIPGWSKESCHYTNMDCLWRLCNDDIFFFFFMALLNYVLYCSTHVAKKPYQRNNKHITNMSL